MLRVKNGRESHSQVCYGFGSMLPEVNAVHGRQVACGEGEGGRGRSFTLTPPHCGAWKGLTAMCDYNREVAELRKTGEKVTKRRGAFLQKDATATPSVRCARLQERNIRNKDPGSRLLIALRQP